MTEHVSVEELADAAEQLLDPARTDAIRYHLAGCPSCAETAALLASVTTTLAADPAPSMPPNVAVRLDAVLAEEQARREAPTLPAQVGLPQAGGSPDVPTAGGAGRPGGEPRPQFDPTGPTRPGHGRAAGWALVAAVLAIMVGFGGYLISARAGMNEPPAGSAALSSSDLKQQASALEDHGAVDVHRFSRAWSCAREVTDGRITGIASITLDGSPALLVYLGRGEAQQATVVQGCEGDHPRVIETIPLTR